MRPNKALTRLMIFITWVGVSSLWMLLFLNRPTTVSTKEDTHLTIESVDYRNTASNMLKNGCHICHITNEYLLAVHHRDHNRSNNNVSNFEILCFNHHVLRHLTNINGRIIYSPEGLTPEDVRIKVGMPKR